MSDLMASILSGVVFAGATAQAHAHLPVTEDADGLTCDICGAELADWAAADEHVETHEGWAG